MPRRSRNSVKLERLVTDEFAIRGLEVRDKLVIGPGILMPFDSTFTDCVWASDFQSTFWPIDPQRGRVVGVTWVERTTFLRCVFQGVGIAGTESDREWIEGLWS